MVWHWGEEEESAFEWLKQAVNSDPVLQFPQDGLPWQIEADTLNRATGAFYLRKVPTPAGTR